jgi:hypothetical protein
MTFSRIAARSADSIAKLNKFSPTCMVTHSAPRLPLSVKTFMCSLLMRQHTLICSSSPLVRLQSAVANKEMEA